MVDETVEMGIRRLLKTFGVQADTAIHEHLTNHPEVNSLTIRIRLEDITTYSQSATPPLTFIVEGKIERGG
jgi:hypothetical protein